MHCARTSELTRYCARLAPRMGAVRRSSVVAVRKAVRRSAGRERIGGDHAGCRSPGARGSGVAWAIRGDRPARLGRTGCGLPRPDAKRRARPTSRRRDVVRGGAPRGGPERGGRAIGPATALAAIHESGIVHRDFKPNNVLLASDGPRVVDFGIARSVNSQQSSVTATGMVVGTPGYLAPEQLTGVPLTPAVDIFAWGATMVFAATGHSPFEADTLP